MKLVEYWIVSNEKTQMFVCTLEEFISSRCSHIYVDEVKMWIGIFIGLYTITTIEEKG